MPTDLAAAIAGVQAFVQLPPEQRQWSDTFAVLLNCTARDGCLQMPWDLYREIIMARILNIVYEASANDTEVHVDSINDQLGIIGNAFKCLDGYFLTNEALLSRYNVFASCFCPRELQCIATSCRSSCAQLKRLFACQPFFPPR